MVKLYITNVNKINILNKYGYSVNNILESNN